MPLKLVECLAQFAASEKMLIDIRIGRPPEGTIAAFEIYGTPTRPASGSRMTLHQLVFAWKRLRRPQMPIPEMTAGGRGDPEAIKQARADAIKAGYSNAAVGAIERAPSDVFLFSKLPEADQRAILRQADDKEFERYVTHAHQKVRAPAREAAGTPQH
jgi:hypothetical protein